MTTPQLRVFNPSGGLVLGSRASFGLNYIGIAAQQSISQASGSATGPAGRSSGVSTYRITSVNRPLPFVLLVVNRIVSVYGVVNLGGNVWEFTVFCGNPTLDANGFETQEFIELYCFAQPTSHSGPGLRINDDTGALRWSVTGTSGRLLQLGGGFDLAGTVGELNAGVTVPALTKPAILGVTQSWSSNSSPAGSLFDSSLIGYGWKRTDPTTIVQASYFLRRWRDDGPFGNNVAPLPASAFLINASGLF